jgi:hypothetical protein
LGARVNTVVVVVDVVVDVVVVVDVEVDVEVDVVVELVLVVVTGGLGVVVDLVSSTAAKTMIAITTMTMPAVAPLLMPDLPLRVCIHYWFDVWFLNLMTFNDAIYLIF